MYYYTILAPLLLSGSQLSAEVVSGRSSATKFIKPVLYSEIATQTMLKSESEATSGEDIEEKKREEEEEEEVEEERYDNVHDVYLKVFIYTS